MSGMSTYLAQKLIDHTLRGQTYTAPAHHYMALFTADPTDDNVTAGEVTGTWYARQLMDTWSAATGVGNSSSNSNTATWNAVTDNPVAVSYWALYDAETAGNLLYSGAFTVAKTYAVDDVPVITAGDAVFTFE